MSNDLVHYDKDKKYGIVNSNFDEVCRFANVIAKSSLAPKGYEGKPENIIVAIQLGFEVGLSPMQALQNIAVVNGRPCIWGDAMLAIVRAHPDFEDIDEYIDNNNIAVCKVKRRGQSVTISSFSLDDAKRAGLLGKAGPWTNYPTRMLQLRARGFALRDAFPDALKGIITREEAGDIYKTERKQSSFNRQASADDEFMTNYEDVTTPEMAQEFDSLCREINIEKDKAIAYACEKVLKIPLVEFSELNTRQANTILTMLKSRRDSIVKQNTATKTQEQGE